jgi:hypothetical protein
MVGASRQRRRELIPGDITVVMDQLFSLSGESWSFWRMVLSVLFDLPLTSEQFELALRHTGRTKLFSAPIRQLWLCVGRRGGKSRVIALIAVFLACFASYPMLAPGELGVVLLVAPTQRQARVLLQYVFGFLHSVPMLERMIVRETEDTVELVNKIIIEVRSPNPSHVRGSTIVTALVDECAFLPQETSAQPDTELLNAIRPAMSTVPTSLLICSSTPHSQRGELHKAYQAHFGNDESPVAFFNASSLVANPALDPRVVDQAYGDDPLVAASEYGVDGFVQFRSDIESFLSAETLEAIVNPDLPLISEAA